MQFISSILFYVIQTVTYVFVFINKIQFFISYIIQNIHFNM